MPGSPRSSTGQMGRADSRSPPPPAPTSRLDSSSRDPPTKPNHFADIPLPAVPRSRSANVLTQPRSVVSDKLRDGMTMRAWTSTSTGLITRNAVVALLAVAGVTLLGLAALDWAGYSGFSISLIWR